MTSKLAQSRRLMAIVTFALLPVAVGSTASASEPEAGCAFAAGWVLTPTSVHPRYAALDQEIGNADGFVCVREQHQDDNSRFSRTIVDNRVEGP